MLKLWDAETGREVATLEHDFGEKDFIFSPDGRRMVSISETFKVWDTHTGAELATVDGRGNARAYSPDSRRIVSASHNTLNYVLHLMGIEFNAPILTPVYLYRFDSKQWDKEPTAKCEWCSQRFVPPAAVLDAIRSIARSVSLSLHDSPCAKLPAEVWDEPPLLSECPHCHMQLKLNPFIVDNRDRIIKPVERKAPRLHSIPAPHQNADAVRASRRTQYQDQLTLWEALPR